MAFLELRNIAKSFDGQVVLDGISFRVEEGTVLALLGPSGSGKTTLLRILAGFETADSGEVEVAGESVLRRPPSKRGVGMVFQHYALFPHLSVADNVAFGLESRGWQRSRIQERVTEMLRLVDLGSMANRRIDEISGGQQQRVALIRALAPEPRLLLLDEPLSNLDPSLREKTRRELLATIRRVGITTVLVTHEQEEAFHLGDQVAVLGGGRLEQLASPETLYREPESAFVASFVGRCALLPGRVEEGLEDGLLRVRVDGSRVAWTAENGSELVVGDRCQVAIRPESLRILVAGEEGPARGSTSNPDGQKAGGLGSGEATGTQGTVLDRRFGGSVTWLSVALERDDSGDAKHEVEVTVPGVTQAQPGDSVWRRSNRSPWR